MEHVRARGFARAGSSTHIAGGVLAEFCELGGCGRHGFCLDAPREHPLHSGPGWGACGSIPGGRDIWPTRVIDYETTRLRWYAICPSPILQTVPRCRTPEAGFRAGVPRPSHSSLQDAYAGAMDGGCTLHRAGGCTEYCECCGPTPRV
jgi:hypothetical protein